MPLRLRLMAASRPPADSTDADDEGPTAERSFEFDDRVTQVRIGRREDLELSLPFTALSAVHARLVRSEAGKGWVLEDLGSRNGTFLGGKRLAPGEKRPLLAGAAISLGHVKILFEGRVQQEGDPVVGSEGGAGLPGPDAPPPPNRAAPLPRPKTPENSTAKPSPRTPAREAGTGTIARRLVSGLFASAPTNVPTLNVISGAPGGGVFRVSERNRRYVFGRVRGCDFRVKVEEISREHAAFTRREDGLFVADLGSKNGLRVNGVRAREQRLQDGDLVQIGPVKLRVFDPEERYLRQMNARAPGSEAPSPAPAPVRDAPASNDGPASRSEAAPARPPSQPPLPGGAPSPSDLHPLVAGGVEGDSPEKRPSLRERLAATPAPRRSTRLPLVLAAAVLLAIGAVVIGFVVGG